MPKVKVNSEACASCGLCVGSRPDVFEFDDDGHAKAVVEEVDGDLGFECTFGAIEVELLIINYKCP
ncbi:MAG: ferredoxin [Bacilli bacterium]|nr:ferredoxin [Bacilli bacterium]